MAKLVINVRGRYDIPQGKDEYNKELTCGSAMELKMDDLWIKGYVEHDGMGYYFHTSGSGKIYLNESLQAR